MIQMISNRKKIQLDKKSSLNALAYIIVIEMVLGGSGRLVTLGSFLTLKYFLFLVAMIYFAAITLTRNFAIDDRNIFYGPVLVFLSLLSLSITNGLFHGYPVSDIISSSQGYFYLFMVFPFTLFINKVEKVEEVLRVIEISSLVLSALSILIFLLLIVSPTVVYSIVNPILLNLTYGFLDISTVLPRVFFKTSPFMALAFIHELFNYVNIHNKNDIRSIVKMVVLLLGCITTMVMGIWLAVGVGVIFCILFSTGKKKTDIFLIILIVAAILLIPFAGSIKNILLNRFSSTDSSFIIKLDQLFTMLNIWVHNFFFGTGYGVKITFNSEVASREMIKFELFWVELLVCMGITGFISYVYMIIKTIFNGLKAAKLSTKSHSIQLKAMITGVIMLCVISSVNPFLNNPIGIGYLIIVMCSINAYYKKLNNTKLVNSRHEV